MVMLRVVELFDSYNEVLEYLATAAIVYKATKSKYSIDIYLLFVDDQSTILDLKYKVVISVYEGSGFSQD